MKNLLFATLLFISQITLFAQLQIDWQQCYGTTGDEISDRVGGLIKFNEGFLFGININQDEEWISNYHGSTDVWLIQSDSLGNTLWEKCYGGSNAEGIHKIIPVNDEYVYLLSSTDSDDGDISNFTNEFMDTWIVKINKNGQIIWDKCIGGTNVEETKDAFLTSDGGLIVMSRISSGGGDISQFYGNTDIWLCKVDSSGNIEWEKTIGNHGYETAVTMYNTSDTTFMVLANVHEIGGMVDCDCKENSFGALDVWLVEMDMDGNVVRQFCYGGTENEVVRNMIQLEDGYVFAASTSSDDGDISFNHGQSDYWIVKIDFSGNIIWEKSFGGSDIEWPVYIASSQDSGLIIMGNTNSIDGDVSGNHSDFGYVDVWVLKVDYNGNLEWEHCYGGKVREIIDGYHNVLKISDYEYIVAAQSGGITEDVKCEVNLSPYIIEQDAWLINIWDCNFNIPTKPVTPLGHDTICVSTDSITTYSTTLSQNARSYHWEIIPENAGTCTQDSIHTYVHWNPVYEGVVKLKVRGVNDCGEGDWSDRLSIQTYMCLGIGDEQDMGKLKAYPNPATSELIVTYDKVLTTRLTNLQVISSYGILVYENELNASCNISTIDVSQWSTGLYIVRIISEGGIVNWKKVLVND